MREDVREDQKLYRKLYEETGEASDVVDRAQAEDGDAVADRRCDSFEIR